MNNNLHGNDVWRKFPHKTGEHRLQRRQFRNA